MNRSTIVEMNFENLSEEDLYSDEDELNNYGDGMPDSRGGNLPSAADRRAHHNALERKRRDHIKDSFSSLRDAVPTLKGDKVKASRAQILKKAADYIGNLKQRNVSCETDIEEILKQNKILLEKVRNIETRAQANGIPLPPGLSEESVASAPLPSTVKSTITTKSAMTKGRTVGASSNGTSVITSGSGSVTLKVEPSNSTSSSGGGSGGTSVISGGSGIVKLEHSNGKATNANKIILLNNSSWRTTNDGGRNTMVIPTSSNSRLVPTIKNGASKIIVQNPQHIIKREITDDSGTSSSTPQHVIHLSGSVTNNGLGNATPIIISSNSLTGTTSQYVIKNGAVHPTGGAYRTLMVQQTNSSNGSSGTGTAGTVSGGSGANSSTPSSQSIHIVSSFGGNVNGQFSKVRRLEVAPISIEKKMKISSDQARIVVPNIKTNGAAASGSNPS